MFDIDQLLKDSKNHPMVDDIVISAHLKKRGVKIRILPLIGKFKPTPAHSIYELYASNRTSTANNDAIRGLF
jgi:hypothetical protein